MPRVLFAATPPEPILLLKNRAGYHKAQKSASVKSA
jgi:hypothetical protein